MALTVLLCFLMSLGSGYGTIPSSFGESCWDYICVQTMLVLCASSLLLMTSDSSSCVGVAFALSCSLMMVLSAASTF